MIINDLIYGSINIVNPFIIDLIKSKPFQRLKHIHEAGATYLIQPIRNVSRYEHSIGTWYLSQKYNRPIEEQVASLLHDLPHTAFSHVIDYVFLSDEQNYHDQFIEKVIMESEIPSICKKHKISLKKVLKSEKFPLLSNKLPDISVDRWDYFMRDGFNLGLISREVVKLFLDNIKMKNQKFYFTNLRLASLFTLLFSNCFRICWSDPISHGSYFLLAEALKLGIKKKVLTEDDFFSIDDLVMEKLKKDNDKEIDECLNRLKPGTEFVYSDKENSDFYGPNKVRLVDPLIKAKGRLQRTSDIIPGLEYYFEELKNHYKIIGVKQI